MTNREHDHNYFYIQGYVYRRDNWRCQDCGVQAESRAIREEGAKLHTHHIQPKSKGGEDVPSNLITLCEDCHQKRHSNPNETFPEEKDPPEEPDEELFPFECYHPDCDKRFKKESGVQSHYAGEHGKKENGLYPWQEDWVYIWFHCHYCGELSEKRQKYTGDKKFCGNECYEAWRDGDRNMTLDEY